MNQVQTVFSHIRLQRGFAFGIIIITALLAFEIFNYSTTDYALTDLLGDLRFLGIRWATILAIAFCGIDFAGIARLFTPNSGLERDFTGHPETWYLFGAWLLAATMNAMLTWWGVSLAILGQNTLGTAVVSRNTLLHIVPIFVAVLVWLIRVLIIGTFSAAGDRLFSLNEQRQHVEGGRAYSRAPAAQTSGSTLGSRTTFSRPANATTLQRNPAPKPPASSYLESGYRNQASESTHHSLSMSTTTNPRNSHPLVAKSGLSRSGAKSEE